MDSPAQGVDSPAQGVRTQRPNTRHRMQTQHPSTSDTFPPATPTLRARAARTPPAATLRCCDVASTACVRQQRDTPGREVTATSVYAARGTRRGCYIQGWPIRIRCKIRYV
eukprot:1195343-Prorocentrum_minimum.AAC.2